MGRMAPPLSHNFAQQDAAALAHSATDTDRQLQFPLCCRSLAGAQFYFAAQWLAKFMNGIDAAKKAQVIAGRLRLGAVTVRPVGSTYQAT